MCLIWNELGGVASSLLFFKRNPTYPSVFFIVWYFLSLCPLKTIFNFEFHLLRLLHIAIASALMSPILIPPINWNISNWEKISHWYVLVYWETQHYFMLITFKHTLYLLFSQLFRTLAFISRNSFKYFYSQFDIYYN